MQKRGLVSTIVIVLIVLAVGALAYFLFSIIRVIEEEQPIVINSSSCALLQLNITEANCLIDHSGINLTVVRGNDNLGAGKLSIFIIDSTGDLQMISLLNFSYTNGTLLSHENVKVGKEAVIISQINFSVGNESVTCPGPQKTQACVEYVEPEVPVSEGQVPAPRGAVRGVDGRMYGDGGYYCDNLTNSIHSIKVYTYKIFNGTQKLSTGFIESAKLTNVCSNYDDYRAENTTIEYDIMWKWDAVGGADGYRIYQYYYLNENSTRDYDYYVDVKAPYSQLYDDGLDLWMRDYSINSSTE